MLALFDQVEDQLGAPVVDHLVISGAVVHRARRNLQQLGGHRRSVDCQHRRLAGLEQQNLAVLHVLIGRELLRPQLVADAELVVRRDVHAVLELVAHHDVAQQAEHRFLGAFAVGPLHGIGVAADLLGLAHGVAELVEAVAQALAAIEQVDLVPDVGDAVAVGRAGHAAAVLEVPGDRSRGLAARAGVVLVGGGLVDHQLGEAGEERLLLFLQPVDRVDVGDVDIGGFGECFLAVGRVRHHDFEVRGKLLEVVDPYRAQQRARRQHEQAAAVLFAALGKAGDADEGLAGARVADVEDDRRLVVVLDRDQLVGKGFVHHFLTPTGQSPVPSGP